MTNFDETYKEYQYAPIKIKIPMTGEVFNIGVILMDENGGSRRIKTISSFKDIAGCIKIDNIEGYDYILASLHEMFDSNFFDFGKYFSSTIYIEQPEWMNSFRDIDSEIKYTFNEIVSINNTKRTKQINRYSNQSIISQLRKIADSKNIKYINFRKDTNISHKKIDVTTSHKDKFIVAGEVCSPHVENFMQHWTSSLFALKQLVDSKNVKITSMYLPIMKTLTNTALKHYNYAKLESRRNNIIIIDSKDPSEFIETITRHTEMYISNFNI